MSLVTTNGRNSAELVGEKRPRAAAKGLFRRFQAIRDMALVLGAWAASWAIVILAVKELGGLL